MPRPLRPDQSTAFAIKWIVQVRAGGLLGWTHGVDGWWLAAPGVRLGWELVAMGMRPWWEGVGLGRAWAAAGTPAHAPVVLRIRYTAFLMLQSHMNCPHEARWSQR